MQALAAIQQQYGATEASHAVEALFPAGRSAGRGRRWSPGLSWRAAKLRGYFPGITWFSHGTVHFTRRAVGQHRAPCASLAGAKSQ